MAAPSSTSSTALPASMLPASGKGKGKSTAVPPPPPSRASLASVAPKGKGKGKSKAMPAPPPRRAMRDQRTEEEVPESLRAPAGANRLRWLKTLSGISGTLWEGMDPWNLEPSLTCHIDLQRLQEQWAAPPPRPAPPAATRAARESLLPSRMAENVLIAMRGLHLTPELIRRALMQDLDLLTGEQVLGLAREILPLLAEVLHSLRAAVAQHGPASLQPAEALLWSIAALPSGMERVRLAALRISLPEEVAAVEAHVAKAAVVVQRLQDCAALRSLMHAILVIRNILAQQQCAAFPLEALAASMDQERVRRPAGGQANSREAWFRHHHPSTMRLVAEVVADAHARECRLRFFRIVAVGRILKPNSARKLVWEYLDDLKDGTLEVFPLLASCSTKFFDDGAFSEFRAVKRQVGVLQSKLVEVQSVVDEHAQNTALSGQLAELNVCMTEAQRSLAEGIEELDVLAEQVCDFVGEEMKGQRTYWENSASGAMMGFQHLGALLHDELKAVWAARAREQQQELAAAQSGHQRVVRSWAPVDTSAQELLATSDPDRIRQARALRHAAAAGPVTGPATGGSQAVQAEVAGQPHSAPRSRGLVHGGVEGAYRRDPQTGLWVRMAAESEVQDHSRHRCFEAEQTSAAERAVRSERRPAAAAAVAAAVVAVTEIEPPTLAACGASCAHGGAIGHYTRDPTTGSWGIRRYA